MYNYLFGMPFRRNFPYHTTVNKNPLPVQPKSCNDRQNAQNKHESYSKLSAAKSYSKLSAANELLLKSSASGGIVLPESTGIGTTYNVASINLDTSAYRNFSIYFNFSCNIITTNARLHLRFQLFKQERYQAARVPVSSSFTYIRDAAITETNTFSYIACDCDSMKCKCCNYSIYVEIMGFDTVGTIMVTNPVLIASIIEN